MRPILLLLLAVTVHALDLQALTKHLKQEEGFSSTPYKDTLGYWTIGYGHRCKATASAISREAADRLLAQDIDKAREAVGELVDDAPEAVEFILVAMVFQMGVSGVAYFKNMLRNINKGDYKAASKNMLRSDWRKQTPDRCARLSTMMASVTKSRRESQ